MSSHLETGHYFNPHAQRITEGKARGAKLAVVDVRLSNTASMADWWLAPWPGTEAKMLLAMAHVILQEDLYDAEFVETWVNWREYLTARRPGRPVTFETFIAALKEEYAWATPAAAAKECGVAAATIVEIARAIGDAGSRFATHIWRNTAAGNLGGWQVARALEFLCVLVGSVGAKGGTNLNSQDKFVAPPFLKPPPQKVWSELLYPREWPLSHHELSFLLTAPPARGSRQDRGLLHARLQPGVDQPGRDAVGAGPARRVQDRAARGPDPGLERDRPVRRLRAADGASRPSATT